MRGHLVDSRHNTRMLDRAVGVEQFRANHPDGRISSESLNKRVKPITGDHLSVIIQQQEIVTPSGTGSKIIYL